VGIVERPRTSAIIALGRIRSLSSTGQRSHQSDDQPETGGRNRGTADKVIPECPSIQAPPTKGVTESKGRLNAEE